jgi:hypothetical protein
MNPLTGYKQAQIVSVDEQIVKVLSQVKITEGALNKANYVSKRICELMQEDVEIGFFLLGNSDRIIQDIYIAHEQRLTKDKCRVTGKGVLNSVRNLRQIDMNAIGWGHSHGDGDNFYSYVDDKTIIDFLNDRGVTFPLDVEIDITSKTSSIRLEKNGEVSYIEMHIGRSPIRLYSACLDIAGSILKEEYLAQLPFTMSRRKIISVKYFFGLTFNARNDAPFGAIIYSYNGESKRVTDNLRISVIDGDCPIDKSVIDNELYQRALTLQDKYAYYLGEITSRLEQSQRYVPYIQRISQDIMSSSIERILDKPETYVKPVHELNIAMKELLCMDSCCPYVENFDVRTEHKESLNGIKAAQSDAMDILIPSLPKLETAFSEISKKSDLTQSRWRRNPFSSLVSEYSQLIETIKNYRLRCQNACG